MAIWEYECSDLSATANDDIMNAFILACISYNIEFVMKFDML